MASGQLLNNSVVFNGLATETKLKKLSYEVGSVGDSLYLKKQRRLRCSLKMKLVIHNRKCASYMIKKSDSSVCFSQVEESFVTEENDKEIYPDLLGEEKEEEKLCSQNIKKELIRLSLPALAGQAIEPMAQLMETAYIGRLGPVELASAAVSITIFNIVSKLFNIPLLGVSTSIVAEDIVNNSIAKESNGNGHHVAERMQLASVSTALLLAIAIGIFQCLALYFGSELFLHLMGISSASPMHAPARQFLSIRALGAPAAVVSIALQGVFRGFKDTKTPVLCQGIGKSSAIFLFPMFMYYFKLGVSGAAISSVISQYMVTFLMIWHLSKRAVLLPPRLGSLQFGGYMKSGGFLVGRIIALLMTTTIGTSMVARQGPMAMAAHQICVQIMLAVSLITDGLASSGQALIATSVSKGDYRSVKDITYFMLKIGLVTGICFAAILGLSFGSIATMFTKDFEVLRITRTGILFVTASQPLNALAFIFDGLHYGVSDFAYAAYSMVGGLYTTMMITLLITMLVGFLSSTFIFYASSPFGLYGVWAGLTLFMGLRIVAGLIRLSTKNGPWWFLHEDMNRAYKVVTH